MSTSARRRLMRDFRRLQSDPPTGISAAPMDDNILKCKFTVRKSCITNWSQCS